MNYNDNLKQMPKNKQPKKIFRRLITFLAAVIILFFIFLLAGRTRKDLHVSFLDVGQGDSALIQTPGGEVILIDGGPDNLVLSRLGETLSFYKRKIDLVVISHFHDDHITGLIEIIRRYQVKKIIYGPEIKDSLLFNILSAAAQENKTALAQVSNSATIQLADDCFLWFLNPLSLKVKPAENNSLITKLDCDQQKFLFSGDNELAVEQALLASGLDLRTDIFKASHHASKTSNTEAFLKAINPLKVIISVGLDNRFGHPALEVLKTINKQGIEIFRTDIKGTIDIFSNIK